MILAQITDLHVDAGRRPRRSNAGPDAALDACVAHLNALDPPVDVVVATGDLVENGDAEEYGRLGEILYSLRAPIFLMPGNHDRYPTLRAGFSRHRYLHGDEGWIQYAVEDWPLRLLALDSVVPGESSGALCSGRLAWLHDRLEEQPDRPTAVFVHHPPFRTGMAEMDRIRLLGNADHFGRIVSRRPNVQRILSGHVHRPVHGLWHGTVASTAPSTAPQIALTLGAEGGAGYVLEPPSCHLHLWDGNEGLITHVSFIGAFERLVSDV
jgi:3',5'-cyclic AMP phosphodiesterase CpdA